MRDHLILAVGTFRPPETPLGWLGLFACFAFAFAWWKWDAIKALLRGDQDRPKDS